MMEAQNGGKLPYDELIISDNIVERTFYQDTNSDEYIWHRDKENRWVESIGDTDWKVQLDNQIPVIIDKVFIPKGIYHRLIKGSGNLKIKITKS